MLVCSYAFHYMVQDGLVYLCMCDKMFSRLAAFQYLEDVKTRFRGNATHTRLTSYALG